MSMDGSDIKVILLGFLMCSLIFAADYFFSLGAISLFYVLFMLVSYWASRKAYHITGTIIVSIILTMIGWTFQSQTTIEQIDVGFYKAAIDYEGLFRVASSFVLLFTGGVLVRQKKKEHELEKLNESLELRILSKISASENRAKRMEQQIKVLQSIREKQAEASIQRLDSVICELKELNKLEYFDVS